MKIRVRPILLLEVLIALAIVSLAILPLIAAHTAAFRSERNFISGLELDQFVNTFYAEMIEKLYLNEIPWDVISGKGAVPIETTLPFKGTYSFKKLLHKPKEQGPYTLYLYQLTFSFKPKDKKSKKEFKYVYQVFLIRDVPGLSPIKEEILQ